MENWGVKVILAIMLQCPKENNLDHGLFVSWEYLTSFTTLPLGSKSVRRPLFRVRRDVHAVPGYRTP